MSVRAKFSPKRQRPVASAPIAALAGLPTGPELAAALAALDPRALTGFETVLVVKAWNRLNNYARGMMVAAVGEVMLRKDPDYGRITDDEPPLGYDGHTPDEVGANEIRTALLLTRRSANKLCALAGDLMVRLPEVRDAMICGRLDQARATIFSIWTSDLCDRHAQAIVTGLLPIAAKLTTAELIQAIQKAAIELDPEWARRRYENGLKARDVRGTISTDGTADLAGTNLPADEVAAACDRIDALAHRVKQAGHWWPLRWIRADIFLGRNSKYVGYDDEQLLAHLLATMPDRPDPDSSPDLDPSSDLDPSPDPDPSTTASGAPSESTVDEPATEPEPTEDDDHHDEPATEEGDPPGERREPVPANSAPPTGLGTRRGLRLLVGLGTIAGLDRRPGDLLGFGLLHAELARRVAAAPHASWYFALTQPDGTPIDIGPLRRRPTIAWAERPTVGASGVEVWLQLSPEELVTLRQHPPPGWQAIIATLVDRTGDGPGGPPNGDPTARIPSDTLRRWINVRDRRCVFPGCRIAPHRTDADHTREYAKGGPTVDINLGSVCGPDHDLRHNHGWTLTQPSPGTFVWTSPLGHDYERLRHPGPEQALPPMPEPTRPEDDWFHYWPNTGAESEGPDSCTYVRPPSPPKPPPPVPLPRPRDPTDDTPPF